MDSNSTGQDVLVVGTGVGIHTILSEIKDRLMEGVKTVLIDYDAHVVARMDADIKLVVGDYKRGLGSCPNPECGVTFVEHSEKEIRDSTPPSRVAVIVGDASEDFAAGGIPEIARILRDRASLVLAVIIFPDNEKGKIIMGFADYCVVHSRDYADCIIAFRTDNIWKLGRITLDQVYYITSNVVSSAISSIAEYLIENQDSDEAKGFFRNVSYGEMSIGESAMNGYEGAAEALENASKGKLTDLDCASAEKIFCNVVTNEEPDGELMMKLREFVRQLAPHSDAIVTASHLGEEGTFALILIMNAQRRPMDIRELGIDIL
jgi:cell division GTPase FtsZ